MKKKNLLKLAPALVLIFFFQNFLISQTVIRGPYIQQSTENSIIIHWKTNQACNSKVWFGDSLTNFTDSVFDSFLTTDHIIKISGLSHSTKYFYAIGFSTTSLPVPNPNYYFNTNPPYGNTGHFRFWVIGDAGRGDNNQRIVRDGFLYKNNGEKLDGWLWLGDNAYFYGLDAEYQVNVFSNNTFENVMKNLVAWAAPGNHDYSQNPLNPAPAYLSIFDFPANGECGGVPSGTEKYFSWNYGNIHFVQLDSYGSDRTDSGAVATWLRADLGQNTSTWTIAYFHHPPYTKGNHDSDNPFGGDPELPQIRSGLVTILEEYGVDLVLNGHSHCYERSKLMDEHYGYSSTLSDSMFVDSTSGCYPASCAYHKDTIGGKGHKGTVYAVVGCSAVASGMQSSWPHPIMQVATAAELGSMLLEVHENKLQARFVNAFAQVLDSFTIIKNMKTHKIIYACKDSALFLYPTWHEPANWWPPLTYGNSVVIFPATDTMIVATDTINCLTDTFDVKILPDSICPSYVGIRKTEPDDFEFSVFPVPVSEGNDLNIIFNQKGNFKETEIFVYDIGGKIILSKKINSSAKHQNQVLTTQNLEPGIYFVSVVSDGKRKVKKIVVI
ncbi:MAG: metallophosphoesterase [Bacteroidia bacterium]|nr:metallophosphoesterase [Bacteroidia bacterium]